MTSPIFSPIFFCVSLLMFCDAFFAIVYPIFTIFSPFFTLFYPIFYPFSVFFTYMLPFLLYFTHFYCVLPIFTMFFPYFTLFHYILLYFTPFFTMFFTQKTLASFTVFFPLKIRILYPRKASKQGGAVEACWAHNPEIGGSKPLSAKVFYRIFPLKDRTKETVKTHLFNKVSLFLTLY